MIKECENCGVEIDVNEDDECLCDDCGEDIFDDYDEDPMHDDETTDDEEA